jgi:hypothetical protein
VVFAIALTLAGGVMVALMKFTPAIFSIGAAPRQADSTATAGRGKGGSDSTVARGDSLAGGEHLMAEASSPAAEGRRDSLPAALPSQGGRPVQGAPRDTVTGARGAGEVADAAVVRADSIRKSDLRTMAKVMESMEPESAAKILRDLPDSDVKDIVFRVKTRQAARILSAIEPERAARLIK